MELFDKHYQEITHFLVRQQKRDKVTQSHHQGVSSWPQEKNRNLVLGKDTAIELGNPKSASTSFLLWVNNSDKVKNGRISVVGSDLPQAEETMLPFGKIVIIGGSDFNAGNSYDRYQELEHLRYDIQLKGYMMRGVSQYQREWSRVSKAAVRDGFSFHVLGGALIDTYSELDYVQAVETIFITSSSSDVLEMKTVSDDIARIIAAMNKMASEMSFDCDTCEYTDVCSDVAELRSMRRTLEKKEAAVYA